VQQLKRWCPDAGINCWMYGCKAENLNKYNAQQCNAAQDRMISDGKTVVNWPFGCSEFCKNFTISKGIVVIKLLENQHVISNDCTHSSREK